jgi:hypothetical protein
VLTLNLAHMDLKAFARDRVVQFRARQRSHVEQLQANARIVLTRQLAADLVKEIGLVAEAEYPLDQAWAEGVVARLLDQARGRL